MTAIQPYRAVRRAMQRALDALPDPDRAIFIRVRFDDEDYRDIALDLGISEREVERGVARALRALHTAACGVERRSDDRRCGRICAWLRGKLPQGWRQ